MKNVDDREDVPYGSAVTLRENGSPPVRVSVVQRVVRSSVHHDCSKDRC